MLWFDIYLLLFRLTFGWLIILQLGITTPVINFLSGIIYIFVVLCGSIVVLHNKVNIMHSEITQR